MLPPIIHERLVSRFKFWDGGIYEGMMYRQGFYKLLYEFDIRDRTQAYSLACQMAEQGTTTVITAAPLRYAIWVGLSQKP